ncbi:MAG TPA: hypothetical protein VGX23_05765 [Actinocrinis sp.]|nr:hypothetical protein [Actinocrinis sp.]
MTWDQWRAPDDLSTDLPALCFDAADYESELRRAETDHSWEWPARTVARLLADELTLTDPRKRAEACGGTADAARRFGCAWP